MPRQEQAKGQRVPARLALLCVIGALCAGCGSEAPDKAATSAAPPALQVEYAGCSAVLRGPVCVLDEARMLRVWVRAGARTATAIEGAAAGTLHKEADVDGGERFGLQVAAAADALVVTARSGASETSWTLAFATDPRPAWEPEVDALLGGDDPAAARNFLVDTLATLDGDDAARARSRLARLMLRDGDRVGAGRELEQAIASHRDVGRVSDLLSDATAYAYILMYEQHRYAEAHRLLTSLPDDSDLPAEGRYFVHYNLGALGKLVGDLRQGLRGQRRAAAIAERTGMTDFGRFAQQEMSELLQLVGRRAEARALLAQLQADAPADLHVCDRAQLLNNVAWNEILLAEAGHAAKDVTALLVEAERLAADQCLDVQGHTVVLVNLALAHWHVGNYEAADAALRRVREKVERPANWLQRWLYEIEARIALSGGDPNRALVLYASLDALGAADGSEDTAWRAAVGRASALDVLGDAAAASDAFAAAEARLDRMILDIPVQEGRESFLARREWATQRYLALLLAQQRVAEAFDVAQRSRLRVARTLRRQEQLASLDAPALARWHAAIAQYRRARSAIAAEAADDWRLAESDRQRVLSERAERIARSGDTLDDALRVLGGDEGATETPPHLIAGETVLLFHPLNATDWVGFARSAATLEFRQLACFDLNADSNQLAECLLTPFAAQIRAAQRLRVLPFGELRALDFHALAFDGEPLIVAKPVVYGTGLGARAALVNGAAVALVVADPRGDLPQARAELQKVTELLRVQDAWRLETLRGPAADSAAVLRGVQSAQLFHFAGHAQFAGDGGWESVIPLASEGALDVGDILALERAPKWVVLSGCETATTRADRTPESIGLAQAFLNAGTVAVIAAARPVADTTASLFVGEFYAAWATQGDMALALRHAVLAVRHADPAADWSSFRLLER